jgi:hypothetical protein
MKLEVLRNKYYEFWNRKLEEEFVDDFNFFTNLLDLSNETIEKLLKEFEYPESKIDDCKIDSYNNFCKSYKNEILSSIKRASEEDIEKTIVTKDEAEKIAEEITVSSEINDLVNKKSEVSSRIANKIISITNKRTQDFFSKVGNDSINNILKDRMPEEFKGDFDEMITLVKKKYDLTR